MSRPTLTASTLRSALRVALVVGTILVVINQGPALLSRRWTLALAVRVALTYAVPLFVSLYAAWRALGDRASAPLRAEAPSVTTREMIELDRIMIHDFGIELEQMMENAGRQLARLARERFLGGGCRGRTVVVLAGSGNNGGGALAAARHLHNWGVDVRVFLSGPPDALARAPGRQLSTLRRLGVPIEGAHPAPEAPPRALVIDGVIGYRLSGPPRQGAADLVRWANGQGAPVLALDVPSGLDATTGAIMEPAVRAAATLTLALPKRGLRAPGVTPWVGELYLADIGMPAALYGSRGVTSGDLFAGNEVVRLS